MGCELVINHCRPSTFPGSWYQFLERGFIGGYQSPQAILTPSFLPRGRHLSSDDANLYQDLILPRASKPTDTLGIFYMPYSYDIAAVDFLHHENPPTWDGVEPATLGAKGQRQTNHANSPSFQEFISKIEKNFVQI
ncbi:hypothetical protein TNCV_3499631 [Trichonephila clavipes]|nr:hypothetical protein TNCV_3499631 [Trichonephila clavipes]